MQMNQPWGVTDLTQTIRRQASLPNSITGALVTDVEQNSASHLAGLRPGNVLLEINREPVKDAAGAVRMSENSTDTATLIKIWHRNGTRFLVVDETATH
jgi:serine protease Do